MKTQTDENRSANPTFSVDGRKEGVRMTSRFSARVLAPFPENHRHIAQGVSAVSENRKGPAPMVAMYPTVPVDMTAYPVGLYTHGGVTRDDHLYFVSNGEGACKIGRTRNFAQRLAGLQHGSPHALAVELILPGMGWQERAWHMAFRHHHMRGEWYRCEHDLGQAINAAELGVEWMSELRSPEAGVSDESWRDRVAARSARIIRDLKTRAGIETEIKRLTISEIEA